MPDNATMTKEAAAAELIARLDPVVGKGGTVEQVTDRVKQIEAKVEGFDKLEVPKVREELEKIRAQQEKLTEQIRRSRRGVYIPGLEEESFSLVKAMLGIKFGEDRLKGQGVDVRKEMDILRATTKVAAQSMGDDKFGGFFVPDQVIPDVIAAIYRASVMINLVGEGTQRISILDGLTGGNVKIPKFLGGMLAYWIGEEDLFTESNSQVGDVTLNPKKLGCLFRMTEPLRMLASYGFEALVRNDMARAIAVKLDNAVLYGKGSDNEPRGVINTFGTAGAAGNGIRCYSAQSGLFGILGVDSLAGAKFQAAWTGGVLNFDGLDNMRLALEEDDVMIAPNAAWISAPRFFVRLKQLKIEEYASQPITDGKAYILGAPMMTDAGLSGIIGEFGKTNGISTTALAGASVGATTTGSAAKFGDVFFGNWGDVVLGRWGGLAFEDDGGQGLGFTRDQVYFKGRLLCDVGVRQARSIIVCPDARMRD